MVIDLKDIPRLKKFIFFKGICSKEVKRCQKCWDNHEKYKCSDSDICMKYTPNYIQYSDEGERLVKDLIDTIEYLTNNFTIIPKNIIDLSQDIQIKDGMDE